MAAKLKVFVTSDGLTDYVVAASSRPKALAAWGVRQDLFKEGQAHETDDPALVKAASAQPGEVLRRPTGAAGKLSKLQARPKAKPAGPTPAQLRRIAELEQRLDEIDAAHARALAAADADIAKARSRREKLAAGQARERDLLVVRLKAARDAPG
jgi:hypothetical protein